MNNKKTIFTHCGIIILMFVVACIYFLPILQGKALPQGDLQKYEGMAKAQKDFHENTGEYTNWCPSMFSGMPGYQITRSPQHSVFTPINDFLTLKFMGRQNDVGVFFLYLIGFYVALIALGCTPWLALLGALAFGLGSYNIIIIEAGHITKAWAMSMMAPILGGMVLCLRSWKVNAQGKDSFNIKNLVWGGILFTLALGCQIALNHIQITFYTAIAGVLIAIVYAIYALKDKHLKHFFASAGVLLVGALLALACNTRHLLINEEYARYTMRGGNEITVTPADLYGENTIPAASTNTADGGLDIDYAFSWSYGVGETYTILVPGAMGGGSGEKCTKDMGCYNMFQGHRAPLYWGTQPFTSGPVYFGAIIVFLFLFGLIVVKGPERWWILFATLIAIVLSWGRNCMGINGWLFDHLPLYNKFRTPSMSLVLANVCMVLMAVLGLKELFSKEADLKKMLRALYMAAGVTVGGILLGIVLCGGFSFSSPADAQYTGGQQWALDLLHKDRHALFTSDSWRSIIFVLLSAVALWLWAKKKVSKCGYIIAALVVLVLVDLWNVDRRYLDKDNYVRNERQLEMHPEQYDLAIDQQAASFGDQDYRVLNLAVNTFNDSKPSAFHNQIGGYSAAKLRRYQDIIDFYINNEALNKELNDLYINGHIHSATLNMLNMCYVVMPNGEVKRNPDACGNAWFVDEVKVVDDANAQILGLNELNPHTTALFNRQDGEISPLQSQRDTLAAIAMDHNGDINRLTYRTHSATDQWAVFSEIYYAPDWKAYIDGKPADYFRANYILRAMLVPAGDHVIEFRNEAPMLHKLDTVTLVASIVLVALIAAVLILYYRKRKTTASISKQA